uniref:BLM10_mid domain-containing protein n=1 Tax=Macrostomum lignano TaxID=282301 RepID=A0A1I8FN52_9PLAT
VEALIRSCVVQMSRNYHSLGTHDPDLANKVVAELTELQDRSSGWNSILHPRHLPSQQWVQFFLKITLDVNVRCRERAFACLAAYVWRRKRRAGRVLLPPPQPAGSAVFTTINPLRLWFTSDWYRNGCDHVFGLPGNKSNAVFQVRDPNAPPDYVDCKLDESLQLILDHPGCTSNVDQPLRSFRHLRHPSRWAQRPPVFNRLWRISWPKSSDAETHQACHSLGSTMWFALVAGTKHWLSEDRNELYQTCLLPALFN